jgi:hypothetical protein
MASKFVLFMVNSFHSELTSIIPSRVVETAGTSNALRSLCFFLSSSPSGNDDCSASS